MKKTLPIVLAVVLISASILALIPAARGQITAWLETENSSLDEGFTAFIPYTLGYFPEDFAIDQAGSDHLTTEDQALYWEWYTSEAYFIILVESMPSRVGEVEGEELVVPKFQPTKEVVEENISEIEDAGLIYRAMERKFYNVVTDNEKIKSWISWKRWLGWPDMTVSPVPHQWLDWLRLSPLKIRSSGSEPNISSQALAFARLWPTHSQAHGLLSCCS